MTLSGAGKKPRGNIVDAVLQDQIRAFTSMDFEDPDAGATAAVPRMTADLIDPREWGNDTDWPWRKTGNRRTSTQGLDTPASFEMGSTDSAPSIPVPSHPIPAAPAETPAFPSEPHVPAVSGSHAQATSASFRPSSPHSKGNKGLVIVGVFVGALAVGVAVAAVLFN